MEPEKNPTQQENKCYPNMPAFASEHSFGLTKREYISSIILSGLVSGAMQDNFPGTIEYFTKTAIRLTDLLIKDLNK